MVYMHIGGRLLIVCGLWFLPWFSASAQVWDLSGIDIVSREEWGANESWTRLDGGSWESFRVFLANYEYWLENGGDDPGGKFAARKARQELEAKRRGFLLEEYPEEVHIDETISYMNGYKLVWPRQMHHNKTKIVIHHTAGSQVYDTPAASLSGMQDIYKYHTLTRGWGDVGYNFLIDPQGTIYEGRAGGKGTIGAHADRNNTSTIGVALMGNFDLDEPTDAAWDALVRLVTALAIEYDINPYDPAYYFKTLNTDPWLSVHTHDSIVGHQDTKVTACPGQYVYDRLPDLKAQVRALMQMQVDSDLQDGDFTFMDINESYYFEENEDVITVQMSHGGKVSCASLVPSVAVIDCERGSDNTLAIEVAHDGYPASGIHRMGITIGKHTYIINPTIVWAKDLELLRQERSHRYQTTYGPIQARSTSEKVKEKIDSDELEDIVNNDIRVFLYDASTTLSSWKRSCPNGCDVTTDEGISKNHTVIEVLPFDGVLRVLMDGNVVETEQLFIENNDRIILENYTRIYASLPMNIFKGDIRIQRTQYKHLDNGWVNDYIVINELPFIDYLKGVGETSEQQHIEKLKTMALLAKTYTLFYITGENEHPSIPEDALYNAVDDPRIFQKYLGASFELYGQKWLQAIEATKDAYIMYDGYVPILPYFHCSAGFTKSARDYFGRTDTPWLPSVLDVATCTGDFEGHGVGLSGDGAEAMAQAGLSYRQIIQWYYPGVEIEEL